MQTTDLKTFEYYYVAADDATRSEYDNSQGGTPDEVAYRKLKLIIKVANATIKGKPWVPDWDDFSQKKWFPVFRLSSGSGFSLSHCHFTAATTGFGSRLCFCSEDLSDAIASQFIDLYKDLLTIK